MEEDPLCNLNLAKADQLYHKVPMGDATTASLLVGIRRVGEGGDLFARLLLLRCCAVYRRAVIGRLGQLW